MATKKTKSFTSSNEDDNRSISRDLDSLDGGKPINPISFERGFSPNDGTTKGKKIQGKTRGNSSSGS